MKKTISILLAFLILLSSTGFSITQDRCKMKGSSFSFKAKKDCCCKKPKSKNCCKKQEVRLKKIEDHYTVAEKINVPHVEITASVLPSVQTFNLSVANDQAARFSSSQHAPPGKKISRTLLYRSILV